MNQHRLSLVMRWTIWCLAVLFYFYEFFLRVAPSIVVNELMVAFSVQAGAVGALVAMYFYIYAPMQIPVGMLMDRYGARRLLTIAALCAGIGTIIFGLAPDYWIAAAGRILLGFGSAFAFLGMVYVCSHWFPPRHLPLLIGIGNSLGMLGAVFGEGPLAVVVNRVGWRPTMIVLGILALVLAGCLYLVMRRSTPSSPTKRPYHPWKHIIRDLQILVHSGKTWLCGIISTCAYLTTAVFGGLWGVPFLQRTHDMTNTQAGFATSMIFIGWLFGGPFIGHLAKSFPRRYLLFFSFILATGSLSPVIYMTGLSTATVWTLLVLTGVFSSAQLLTFSLAVDVNPSKVKGAAVGLVNFMTMLAASGGEPLIGYLLQIWGGGQQVNGAILYPPEDYQMALTLFPLSLLIGAILSLFLATNEETI